MGRCGHANKRYRYDRLRLYRLREVLGDGDPHVAFGQQRGDVGAGRLMDADRQFGVQLREILHRGKEHVDRKGDIDRDRYLADAIQTLDAIERADLLGLLRLCDDAARTR